MSVPNVSYAYAVCHRCMTHKVISLPSGVPECPKCHKPVIIKPLREKEITVRRIYNLNRE